MGPSLSDTCRLLIQTVRQVAQQAMPGKVVQVGIHTSLDFRELATDPDPDDPVAVTFPYIALIGPALVNEDERPIKIGHNVYRDKDLGAGTVVKQPFPQFKHLDFQVVIEAINMQGDTDATLPLVQAITAWAQECPRVAGLMVDFTGEFNVTGLPESGNGDLGDAVRSVGALRLRSWRSYGGAIETVKIIKSMSMGIFLGDAPQVAWRPEASSVSDALRGAAIATDGSMLAVGDGGAVTRSTQRSVWVFEDIGSVPNLNAVWTSPGGDSWAVGDDGVVLHCPTPGTWNTVTLPNAAGVDLKCVFGTAANRVLIGGAGGAIWSYDGTTWTRLASGLVGTNGDVTSFNAIWGIAGGTLQCVGDGGAAFEISTGNAITSIPTGVTADLRTVIGTLAGARFLCGGEAGTILQRNVGDNGWSLLLRGAGQMMEIYGSWKVPRTGPLAAGATPEPVYFCGDFGRVIRLSGYVFDQLPASKIPQTLFALCGTAETNLVGVGEEGEIVRYAAAGAVGRQVGTITR